MSAKLHAADSGGRRKSSARTTQSSRAGQSSRSQQDSTTVAARAAPGAPRRKGSGTGARRTMRDDVGKDRRTGLKQAGLTHMPRGKRRSGGERVTGPGHVEMDSNLKEE